MNTNLRIFTHLAAYRLTLLAIYYLIYRLIIYYFTHLMSTCYFYLYYSFCVNQFSLIISFLCLFPLIEMSIYFDSDAIFTILALYATTVDFK